MSFLVRLFVAEKGDGITHCGKAEAEHDRVLRLVDELVDGAAVEIGRSRDLNLGRTDEIPSQIVRCCALRVLGCSDRE